MSLQNFDKTKALETIKDLNQVIFFGGVVIVMLLWLGAVVSNGLFRSSYTETGVHVAAPDKPKETKPPTVSYSKSFHSKINDTYVFSVTSYTTDPSRSSSSMSAFDRRKGREYSYVPTVNFIFVKPNKASHLLFKADSMIEQFELADFDKKRGKLLEKSVYRVATEDTNKDGLINHQDRHTLYVSSYDGLEVKAVLDQIMSFQLIEDNTLLLSQGTNKGTVFYEYRVDTGALTELTSSVL